MWEGAQFKALKQEALGEIQ